MANNKNNNTGQNTSPSSRSNNVGNKSNQISELDLINVNADKVKKELGSVFSYINDNLKNINKDTDKSINSLTKKALSANKTVFNDLFKSLDKYSDKLDDTLNKLNSLGTGTSSGVTASANSPKFSNVVYDKAIFNNATFNHSVFNDVIINEKGGGSSRQQSSRPTASNGPRISGGRTGSRENFGRYGSNRDRGILNREYDYEPGNISIPNNKYRMMVNDKRAQLRPIWDKADWLTNRGQLMDTNKLTKILSIKDDVRDIGKTLLNFAKPYWEKAKGAFEQNYTKVAGLTSPEEAGTGGALGINTGTDMFNDMLDSTVDKYGKAAFSYSEEMIPMMVGALEKGFKGQEAISKAQQDMVASKILPWMDTQSEAWINMSFNIDKNSLDQIKNQQLMIKQSEQGNRLLQDGIINYLTSDLGPLISNIDSGVAAATGYQSLGEYSSLMESYVAQGMSTNDAYKAASEVMNAQKDVYGALTSGNVNQILLGAQFAGGAGVNEAVEGSTVQLANLGSMANESGDIIGGAAIANELGYKGMLAGGWTQNANQLTVTGSDTDYRLGSTAKLDSAIENISNYNTEDKKYKNTMENTIADATQSIKNVPTQAIGEIASTVKDISKAVWSIFLTNAAFKMGGGGVGGMGTNMLMSSRLGTGLSNFKGGITGGASAVKAGEVTGLGGKIGAGLTRGGIAAGGASTATAAAAGLAGLGTAAYMGYNDAQSAMDKHKDWGVSKGAAGVGGAIAGGEGGLANAGSNALKGAALGAGIGSFIPGVGTLIGGAVGGIAGGLLGFIGGDNVSKGAQAVGDAITGNENKWASHATGLTFVPEDNYKANLHKGEMVATAKTANKLRKKGITGKESSEELINNRLEETSIDFTSITSILDVISDKVGNIVDVINPETKPIEIKFDNDVDTNLTEDEKKDK